jgi:hypothetical protein
LTSTVSTSAISRPMTSSRSFEGATPAAGANYRKHHATAADELLDVGRSVAGEITQAPETAAMYRDSSPK